MSPSILWTLYKREIRSIFVSPIAYVVLFGCALVVGSGFSMALNNLIESDQRGYSIIAAMLCSFIFWILILIQAPLISMRAFSEEYKMGTIEMLLTAPVREWEVVLGKFLAVLTFYVVLWLPAALDVSYVYAFSNQTFDLTPGMVLLPALAVFCIGALSVAIGLFASALTRNQIVAAILGFAFLFVAFCVGVLGMFDIGERARDVVSYVSGPQHMEAACRGLFDTRPLIFYASSTLFFLFLTQRVLESRRLRA